ncbi:hypothetical protein TA3x_004492 [Tundrisphaera sp. TA3]|uniref:hypothetical protein n=1 Tax=Tundrisphaera sp. TA3 TaxID=3435775 RepID=UPI003EB6F9B8
MSTIRRRTLLSALGVSLPFGLTAARAGATGSPTRADLTLRFRPFEEAVRSAFADWSPGASDGPDESALPFRRVEVGDSDRVRAGLQGCHNDRPFAGFPAGNLRVIRSGSAPGPSVNGVRLYVSTVDIAVVPGPIPGRPARPLDFATLPPAPTIA